MNEIASDTHESPSGTVVTLAEVRSAPERTALGNILLLASSAVAIAFLLDASIFRTFYPRHIEPDSYLGNFESALMLGREKKFTRPHRVVLLGDSQIGEGFSPRVADEAGKDKGWEFLNAAVGGASLRSWYYMIRDLDPDRSSFDVIMLPFAEFADLDIHYDSNADRVLDLRWIVARLKLSDIPEFAGSIDTPALKVQAVREALFEGLVYRRDVREFLRDPITRERNVRLFNSTIADAAYAYQGHQENLAGLAVDWKTYTFHFPDGMSEAEKSRMQSESRFQDWTVLGPERRYRKEWLGKIIARYRGTKTKIVFFRIPYRPFPIPYSWKVDSESFVAEAAREPHVLFLDEHLFEDLQRPENFWDTFHLNQRGRDQFSARLATELIKKMDAAPSK